MIPVLVDAAMRSLFAGTSTLAVRLVKFEP